jgi:glutamate dehydrogenase
LKDFRSGKDSSSTSPCAPGRTAATRARTDDFSDALAEQLGEESAARLLRKYKDGFPEGYKEDFPARTAATDVRRIEALPEVDGLGLNLYRPVGAPDTDRRLKIYRTGTPISLTQVLPLLSRMRVEVVDERPYEIIRREAEASAYIYDFGLRFEGLHSSDGDRLKDLFQEAFVAVWRGQAESDGFNALVPLAGLSWRQASVLRAYAKYLRQAGSTFSQTYLEECLSAHVDIARMLIELFETRFDPDSGGEPDERTAATERIRERIDEALDQVASLDQDRIRVLFSALSRPHCVRASSMPRAPRTVLRPPSASSWTPRRSPSSRRRVPGSRSGCTPHGWKACICATVRSRGADCAGRIVVRISALRFWAW